MGPPWLGPTGQTPELPPSPHGPFYIALCIRLRFQTQQSFGNPDEHLNAAPNSGTFTAMDPRPPAPRTAYKPSTVVQALHMKH